MLAKKQQTATYKHVLVFVKPKFSRDKGLIRLCRNDPQHRFKFKTIQSVDHYINTEQYEKQNLKDKKQKIYRGIIPIMYLSEWKASTKEHRKLFSQSLCRGFPRLQIISHKGNLANLLNKYYIINCKDKLIKNELFYPRTWVLPTDIDKFVFANKSFCDPSNFTENEENENVKFIIKPQGKSKGNGISLVTKKSDINFEEFVIIQNYIANPLLINNHKFDLRLYVFIASINPLQIYLYDKGLVRFASAEYSQSIPISEYNINYTEDVERFTDREILCSHLTNYTLNKKSPLYKNKDKEIKWSLDEFWNIIEKNKNNININMEEEKKEEEEEEYNLKQDILKQIHDIIINVFKIGYKKLNEGFGYNFSNEDKNHGRCFDILGMDVLIDTNYKCWLMEFNRYPSLKCEHKVDKNIKYDLCNDLFKMLKPRIVCNHSHNIMFHHKMPIILNPNGTKWKRVV